MLHCMRKGVEPKEAVADHVALQIAVQPQSYTWTSTYGCEYGTQVCVDGIHGFRCLAI
jgi:hypothetical protein